MKRKQLSGINKTGMPILKCHHIFKGLRILITGMKVTAPDNKIVSHVE